MRPYARTWATMRIVTLGSLGILVVACTRAATEPVSTSDPTVQEYSLQYPGQANPPVGSTHEITYQRNGGSSFWLTAPSYNSIVNLQLDGTANHFVLASTTVGKTSTPTAPHGIDFNPAGQMFVSFEGTREVARVSTSGSTKGTIEVVYPLVTADPHGLGIDPDGTTIWVTGKSANNIARITLTASGTLGREPTAAVEEYALPSSGSTPRARTTRKL